MGSSLFFIHIFLTCIESRFFTHIHHQDDDNQSHPLRRLQEMRDLHLLLLASLLNLVDNIPAMPMAASAVTHKLSGFFFVGIRVV